MRKLSLFSLHNLHVINLSCLYLLKAALNTRQMDMASVREANELGITDQLVHDFNQQLQIWPRLRDL